MTLPPPSTPITEALASLHLTADDRAACLALTGVRTLGDLITVVACGEVTNVALAGKLGKALGVEAPKVRADEAAQS